MGVDNDARFTRIRNGICIEYGTRRGIKIHFCFVDRANCSVIIAERASIIVTRITADLNLAGLHVPPALFASLFVIYISLTVGLLTSVSPRSFSPQFFRRRSTARETTDPLSDIYNERSTRSHRAYPRESECSGAPEYYHALPIARLRR